jgi:hypothetical protein
MESQPVPPGREHVISGLGEFNVDDDLWRLTRMETS